VVSVVPEPETFALRRVVVADTLRDATAAVTVHLLGATAGYFGLTDVPILLGRDIEPADTMGDEMAVVIGSNLARTLWGDANPVGHTMLPVGWQAGGVDSTAMRVVGVFDASRLPLEGPQTWLLAFTSHDKRWRQDALLIRTQGPAQAFRPALRTMIRAEAPGLPLTQLATFAELDAQLQKEVLLVDGAAGGAGALALLLACLGLYGIVALAVRQRTREIGIRMAVGAHPARVVRMFLASGMRVSVVALLIGLPVSLAGLRVLMSRDIAMAPQVNVWLIGLGVGVVLLIMASAATWLPARHAARVDPATTLRVE
jgi:hypothetical protein